MTHHIRYVCVYVCTYTREGIYTIATSGERGIQTVNSNGNALSQDIVIGAHESGDLVQSIELLILSRLNRCLLNEFDVEVVSLGCYPARSGARIVLEAKTC